MDQSNGSSRLPLRAVEADLGTVRHSPPASAALRRHEVMGAVEDIQRRADVLMGETAPQTAVERFIDRILPSPVRREKARGDQTLVRAEVDARITIHQHVKDAETRRMAAYADAYGTACELEASKEIAKRLLDAATCVDTEIDRSGSEFDAAIDDSVDRAADLRTMSARQSAAERVERRKAMRAELEDLAMEEIQKAVRRSRG